MRVVSFSLVSRTTVACAAVVLLLVSGCFMGTCERFPAGVGRSAADEAISEIIESMTTTHSYRVDGSLDMRLPNGDPNKHVTVRGDYVSPDRLELDVEGLRLRMTEQVVIVGEKCLSAGAVSPRPTWPVRLGATALRFLGYRVDWQCPGVDASH